jgi:Protein of unknown function (DUF2934)
MVKTPSSKVIKTPSSKAAKTPGGKAKSGKTKTAAASVDRMPAIELGGRLDEHLVRERAYGIWIEEGRPHGRDLAHWQRASEELQRDAR